MSAAGRAPIGAPSSSDAVGGAVNEAGDGLQEGRLARPVGADDGDGLALLQRRVDAVQRLEVAVEGRELAGLEAAACVTPRCRYRSRAPRASASPPAASPSAILRPKLSTTRRSTTASSACTTCSIQRMVTPAWRDVADGGDQFEALALGQAAGDLVEQQKPRRRRERARHLQPLALEQRQRAGERVGALDADPSRSRISPQDCGDLALRSAAAVDRADQQVLEHGEVLERLRDLVGAADAGAAAPLRRLPA